MIHDIKEYFIQGGWCVVAIAILSAVLYFLITERFFATGSQLRALNAGKRFTPEIFEIPGLRRMALIRAGIVIAPLLGLLGTVTGMIEVFGDICQGGYATSASGGISKALLTTQYGLVVAAPGLLAEKILNRRKEKIIAISRAGYIADEVIS